MLFLVILVHKYGEKVLVQIGTLVIDHLVTTITEEELQQAGDAWEQVHLSTAISKRTTVREPEHPQVQSQRSER